MAEGLATPLRREGHRVSIPPHGPEALAHLRDGERPDVVLLDLGASRDGAPSLLGRLRADGIDCPVLVLAPRGDGTGALDGFRDGVDDRVAKPIRTRTLLARLRRLAARQALRPVPAHVTDAHLATRYGISPRQAIVTRLVAQGLTNAQIAAALAISPYTARNHVEQILAKIGIPSRGLVGTTLREDFPEGGEG